MFACAPPRLIATDRTAHGVVCLCVLVTTASRAETTEPIDMPFISRVDRVGPRNHVVVHVGATWRIRWIDPCAAATLQLAEKVAHTRSPSVGFRS